MYICIFHYLNDYFPDFVTAICQIKKFLVTNDNENTTTQDLWGAAKAVLRGKFIAIQSYFKKQEKP